MIAAKYINMIEFTLLMSLAIVAVPYIQSLGFERDERVQALGLSFTFSTLALACGLWWHGALQHITPATSLMAVAATLVGLCSSDNAFESV